MSRPLVFVAALGVLVLTLIMLLLALNLLPTVAEAEERGTFAALVVTWIMAGATILCGLVLAGYLVMTALRTGRPPAGAVARVP